MAIFCADSMVTVLSKIKRLEHLGVLLSYMQALHLLGTIQMLVTLASLLETLDNF